MPKTRRQYAGGAVASTLSSSVAASGVTAFTIAAATGWPSSAGVPLFVVVSPQTSSEEKMSVTISGTTLTVVSRGVDGTTASSHASGATIYPVFTATDADEANELTAKYANAGSIVYQGASTFTELALGTSGYPLVAGASAPAYSQLTATGIADNAVTAAKILAGAVGTSEIADANVTLAKLASAVANALVPVGTIAAYAGVTAPTGWLLCDGTSTTGYTSLAALVGATTPDMRGRFPIGDNASLTLLGTGGSLTITANNLPAHSHPNTATASTSVSVSDPGHSHTIDTFDVGTGGSAMGSPEPGYGASAGDEANVVNTATTGITASATTTVTMTNANNTTTASDYYPPYLVVNYIIKHD